MRTPGLRELRVRQALCPQTPYTSASHAHLISVSTSVWLFQYNSNGQTLVPLHVGCLAIPLHRAKSQELSLRVYVLGEGGAMTAEKTAHSVLFGMDLHSDKQNVEKRDRLAVLKMRCGDAGPLQNSTDAASRRHDASPADMSRTRRSLTCAGTRCSLTCWGTHLLMQVLHAAPIDRGLTLGDNAC